MRGEKMDISQILDCSTFAVAGDTVTSSKYAYRIKKALEAAGYKAYGVGKELAGFNEIEDRIDVIDLCINPARGLALLKELDKPVSAVLIQPGASSDEIKALLDEKGIAWFEGCVLRLLEARGLYTFQD